MLFVRAKLLVAECCVVEHQRIVLGEHRAWLALIGGNGRIISGEDIESVAVETESHVLGGYAQNAVRVRRQVGHIGRAGILLQKIARRFCNQLELRQLVGLCFFSQSAENRFQFLPGAKGAGLGGDGIVEEGSGIL